MRTKSDSASPFAFVWTLCIFFVAPFCYQVRTPGVQDPGGGVFYVAQRNGPGMWSAGRSSEIGLLQSEIRWPKCIGPPLGGFKAGGHLIGPFADPQHAFVRPSPLRAFCMFPIAERIARLLHRRSQNIRRQFNAAGVVTLRS